MAAPTPEMAARLAQGREWIDKTHGESAENLKSRMRHAADKFLNELEGLSEPQSAWSPGEGQWSVRQVCLHVANSVRDCGGMISCLARGDKLESIDIRLGILDPDPGNLNTILDSVEAAFNGACKASDCLENSPELENRFTHPYFGNLNCREWMAFNIMHTNVHVRQVQRIKNTLGYPPQ